MSNDIDKNIDEKIELMAAKILLKRCKETLDDYTSASGRNNDDVLQAVNDIEIFLGGDL